MNNEINNEVQESAAVTPEAQAPVENVEPTNTRKKGIIKKFSELTFGALEKMPAFGAETLFEAIQSFMLLWSVMCLEQAPNPFAFSVGNADRIFEPYREKENLSREESAALFKHFLFVIETNISNRRCR